MARAVRRARTRRTGGGYGRRGAGGGGGDRVSVRGEGPDPRRGPGQGRRRQGRPYRRGGGQVCRGFAGKGSGHAPDRSGGANRPARVGGRGVADRQGALLQHRPGRGGRATRHHRLRTGRHGDRGGRQGDTGRDHRRAGGSAGGGSAVPGSPRGPAAGAVRQGGRSLRSPAQGSVPRFPGLRLHATGNQSAGPARRRPFPRPGRQDELRRQRALSPPQDRRVAGHHRGGPQGGQGLGSGHFLRGPGRQHRLHGQRRGPGHGHHGHHSTVRRHAGELPRRGGRRQQGDGGTGLPSAALGRQGARCAGEYLRRHHALRRHRRGHHRRRQGDRRHRAAGGAAAGHQRGAGERAAVEVGPEDHHRRHHRGRGAKDRSGVQAEEGRA